MTIQQQRQYTFTFRIQKFITSDEFDPQLFLRKIKGGCTESALNTVTTCNFYWCTKLFQELEALNNPKSCTDNIQDHLCTDKSIFLETENNGLILGNPNYV